MLLNLHMCTIQYCVLNYGKSIFNFLYFLSPTPATNSDTPAALYKIRPSNQVRSFLPCKQTGLFSHNSYLFVLTDSRVKFSARFDAESSAFATCKVTSPKAFHTSVSFTRNFEYSSEQELHKFGSWVTEPSTIGAGYVRELQ